MPLTFVYTNIVTLLCSNKKETRTNPKSLVGDSKNEKPLVGSSKCDTNISVNQTVAPHAPSETISSQQSRGECDFV